LLRAQPKVQAGCCADSPVEGNGFETSVPRHERNESRSETGTVTEETNGRADPEDVTIRTRLSAGAKRIRTLGPTRVRHPRQPQGSLLTPRWRQPDSNPRSRVSGSALFETVFTPCNRSGARYAANGTLMTATDRCRLASTFMDNTCWSTPNGLALAGPHQGRDRGRAARAAAGLPGRRRG
jgi:hypothetical protein